MNNNSRITRQISVIIPTLNEAGSVGMLTERLHQTFSAHKISYELIFIDDFSTDDTVDELSALAKTYPIKIQTKKGKRGKAQSLLQGFDLASSEILVMIDADLQYPPEAIPQMLEKINNGFDVVVASRSQKHVSFVRLFLSRGFEFVFGRLLHNFNFDVQSGLKAFRRKIIDEVELKPDAWTFDLEFLTKARNAGHKITHIDIVFEQRLHDESKVNFREAIFQIGWHALKTRFKRMIPVQIQPTDDSTMIGAGLAHKKKRFITHTTLSHEISAIETFVTWQKFTIFALIVILAICFFLKPLLTAIIVIAVLSVIYFVDVFFNFFVVSKSLNAPPEINFTSKEIRNLTDEELPIYTILVPLFREANVLPGFLEALERLDYPKEKLDVMLLLESVDTQTITAAERLQLPSFVRTLIVPASQPQTKPKACNYGLSHARGEYLVVYDAEDLPEPTQLKKAYLGFQKVSSDVRCLQAKLNYHNPKQNILTRLFTAEYSLWFDVILPGLQSINGYIPLGGTSNHFKTKDLLELRGWDPFNVTEDCDLGARLFKAGYKTAVIDSTTYEEANSNLRNWIRQRSRWIKGYMQTYLVHMRHPVKFFKESGIHAVVFQLVVGGKIAFLLINPILWLTTIAYFAFRATVGSTIEALYPSWIFYIAVTSLVIGNFLCLYYYMIGCAKRGHYSVIKYVYLVPVYWFMASFASLIALYQLIVKPYYWEKTNHGLLKNQKTAEDSAISTPVHEPSATAVRVRRAFSYFSPSMWTGGTILVFALTLANFLNFLFNAFLGRALTLTQFAAVTLVSTIWSLVSLLTSAVSTTMNQKSAFLTGQNRSSEAVAFRKKVFRKGFAVILTLTVFWLLITPTLSKFFNLPNPLEILLFLPMFSFAFATAVNNGFLQGSMKLRQTASVVLVESLSKILAAAVLVYLHFPDYVYTSIAISVISVSLYAYYLVRRNAADETSDTSEKFAPSFYFSALFAGLSTAVFMNLDVLLVNHFLSASLAGEYALLSLVGKMVFYFGSLPNALMVTFVSRDLGKKLNPLRTFYILLTAIGIFVGFAALGMSLFGRQIVPVFFGVQTLGILPFIPSYVLAMSMFTITACFVTYHLARKEYVFPILSLLMSVIMALSIIWQHANIAAVVVDIVGSSAIGLGLVILMHVTLPNFGFISSWFLGITNFFEPKVSDDSQKRILIFNWRDTKHVFAGGAEVYIQEMAKRWANEGNSVTIFCGNDGRLPRQEVVEGINVIRRGGFYLVYFWAFVYYLTKFRGKFDLIIDCENGIPFFTPFYATEEIYCLLHHVHQEVFSRSLIRPLAWFARFLEKRLMPLIYRNVKFITISQSSRRDIQDLGLGRKGVFVINPGVNLSELIEGEKSKQPTVVYLGRLKAYKSVDILIKAFFIVASKVRSAKLIIAGNGEEELQLKKLTAKMDLGNSVQFVGKVSEQEKIRLLQKAWVFVNPSFMEGWGITTIEANACGTPIVAADVPGLRDSVLNPKTGFLVEHGDYAAFANKIIQLIKDAELREQMSRDAREWAENFDWDKTSKEFLDVIGSNRLAEEVVLKEEMG
jgi:cellulose synthase/poly-beta-1,6-N-acetylglucosamine synthase-like glycosyltransferase/glycosyltransferase involved in cell wall biosynthesis/O-antigen/teichoic acid export membrane protein